MRSYAGFHDAFPDPPDLAEFIKPGLQPVRVSASAQRRSKGTQAVAAHRLIADNANTDEADGGPVKSSKDAP